MTAKETKLQDIIEGTKQYVVPLFQRTYSWDKKEWDTLWNDMMELSEMENPRTHFIGSIVNMPTNSVPEGVNKFLLIDGQQRLTTIFVILALLRDRSKELGYNEFADEIHETLLVNKYKKDLDYFKLIPTQIDRDTYKKIINSLPLQIENQLSKAHNYFSKKLQQTTVKIELLKKVITNYFSVVSIVLDADDNPYLVFESLNAKGRPLTPADLIRNYVFMRIHVDNQIEIYNNFWQPMQEALNSNLTEFIRHFLMRKGSFIKQSDVYFTLKENVTSINAIDYLKELNKYSEYYNKFINPQFEQNQNIQKYFIRLNRIEVTTAYPFLLNIYGHYVENKISADEFVEILKLIENFLIRRFVCNIASNQLNRVFPAVYNTLISKYSDNFVQGIKDTLQTKNYPKDYEFIRYFKEIRFYGAHEKIAKTKLILETINDFFEHKEKVDYSNLTIEHIMPQTLTDYWKTDLGGNWETTHELLLHNIGNLTLTGYNPELSNKNFKIKKNFLIDSHLELNKYFENVENWTSSEIELRSEYLADLACEVWKYFGKETSITEKKDITGTTPSKLTILGQTFEVGTWRDVLELTLNTVAELEPEKFEVLFEKYPHQINNEKDKLNDIRKLKNGFFIECRRSAKDIQRFCYQAIETIELTRDDWDVQVM